MMTTLRFNLPLKPIAASIFGVVMMTACGDSAPQSKGPAIDGRTSFEVKGDHALGNPGAKVTVVEYASVTCPTCANWDMTVWPDFREKYVDTGKVRYVFREFPTPPEDLANAGHLLANCAGEDKFFDLIHIQFKRQREILTSDDVRGEYERLAKSAGMNEAEFTACMTNEVEIARLEKVINDGYANGVTSTPTFFINGKKSKVYKLEDFDEAIAETLGEISPPETSNNNQ